MRRRTSRLQTPYVLNSSPVASAAGRPPRHPALCKPSLTPCAKPRSSSWCSRPPPMNPPKWSERSIEQCRRDSDAPRARRRCAPSDSMEYYLAGQHWLDALTPPLEEHLSRLASAILVLLGRTTTIVGDGSETTAARASASPPGSRDKPAPGPAADRVADPSLESAGNAGPPVSAEAPADRSAAGRRASPSSTRGSETGFRTAEAGSAAKAARAPRPCTGRRIGAAYQQESWHCGKATPKPCTQPPQSPHFHRPQPRQSSLRLQALMPPGQPNPM